MHLFQKKDINHILSQANSANGLRRSLTATNLIALGIGAIVGTGIFVITGQAAADYAGPALTLSFVLSALCCIFAGLCYAEFAAMLPISGSVYAYSYVTMGELPAWFIGWTLILEYLFACASVSVGWSGYMTSLLAGWDVHLPAQLAQSTFEHLPDGRWVWTGSLFNFPAVFILTLIATFLLGGIRQSAFVNNIIVVIKVAVILLFIGFGLSYIDTANFHPYIPPNTGEFGHFGWSGILRGAGAVFYAYLGFDALSTAAQETHNPQRDMPRGILVSLLICAVLYIAVTTVLTGIVNYRDLHTDAPIALAIDRVGQPLAWLSPLIKLGAIAGLSSVILVMMLGQSRIYYAIAADGLLPSGLARLTRRGTPGRATILSALLSIVFAGLFPLHVLTELVSIGTLMAFTIVCLSILVLRRRRPDLHRPFRVPFVPFVPLLGAGICILQMCSLPSATWLRLLIWTALGLLFYFFYSRHHSMLNK